MKTKCFVPLVMVSMSLVVSTVGAETVTLSPTKDARIISGFPAQGSNQWLSLYSLGRNDRSLLQFDVSTIPQNSLVNSAILTLFATQVNNPNHETMSVHRLVRDWLEYEVTWNQAANGISWTAAGGDYNSFAYASNTSHPTVYGEPVSWDVKNLIQQWIVGTYPNQGMEIINSGTTNALHFGSREWSEPQYRPILAIDFVVVPEPANLMLLALGLLGLFMGPWRRQLVDLRGSKGRA